MWPERGRAAAALALALSALLPVVVASDRDVAVFAVREPPGSDISREADVVYPLAVLASADWPPAAIERAVGEVERIFAQCGTTVTAGPRYRLQAPADYRELDEPMQARLLERLPAARPIVLLVDRTVDGDVAYSYLPSAPVASRGSAWITRHSDPACLGPLLAHELGHILLDSERHSDDRDNLMFHSCTVANVAGTHPGTNLTEAQCARLRAP